MLFRSQGETIYTYAVCLTSNTPEYRLAAYRADGTPMAQYALELADLLPASGGPAQDAVIGLAVRGDCVLLHTLNARTRALVLAEGELRPVSVPPTLEESLPGGYRLLLTEPDVLLLDEPTRGIDVGAKYEIYQLILDLANKGKTVIMVSSEMPELLGVCDRILVMSGGRLAGEVDAKTATQEDIMRLAAKYV